MAMRVEASGLDQEQGRHSGHAVCPCRSKGEFNQMRAARDLPAHTSRESLEASILFLDGDTAETSSELCMSDENLEGYSTPTGSSSQLDSNRTPSHDRHILNRLNRPKNDTSSMESHTMASVDMSQDSKLQKSLIEENRVLKAQIKEIVNGSRVEVIENLLRENEKLQEELKEAKSYVDQVDVEAEQQYTELSSEITELCDLIEKKDNDIKALKEKLSEVNKLVEKNNDIVEQQKQNVQRQTGVIESLRDDLDSEKEKNTLLAKEKEKLQDELNSVKKLIETEKDDALAKDVLLAIELEDMQRELEKQKEILASTSIAQIVERWERRVLSLENEVRERDVLIHAQQSVINDLKRNIRENCNFLHSGASSSDSFHTPDNNPSSRFSVVKYILSDVNSQLANVYAIARVLDLSSQELDYLEKSLESKQSKRYIY
ncbi:hypothetical protein TELCIR_00299 [Teladorsagia circumcincta]|uniref:GRIP domain protein n=1 Tax=Teladorsagia circumcincta TaxID=45464 RepID=A0A2G9V6J0_TELCI|nr:hypothetical protein TELCIR_00299 [Teladorsagia circumcincta]